MEKSKIHKELFSSLEKTIAINKFSLGNCLEFVGDWIGKLQYDNWPGSIPQFEGKHYAKISKDDTTFSIILNGISDWSGHKYKFEHSGLLCSDDGLRSDKVTVIAIDLNQIRIDDIYYIRKL